MIKKLTLVTVLLLVSVFAKAQVGVGTTTPYNALDVESNSTTKTATDINNTSTGDAVLQLQLNGTTKFSMGIDNSDADKFKISTDSTFNVIPPALSIDASQKVGVGTASPNSTLDIQGSLGYKVTTLTAATTLNQTHNVVLCNTGPYTVTLPAAAANTGKVYYIKNIDLEGDDITIDGNGSETIDGNLNYYLHASKQIVRIISDGSNWHVLEEIIPQVYQSFFNPINCDGSTFTWSDVTNGTTGKTWMDRNLGAKQVATSSTDADAYGDLYQWGRLKDGHQCRNSGTTSILSNRELAGHSNFIINNGDWQNPQNDNLWQGVNGINNPCPRGYRLPTKAELDTERLSWTSQNSAGAFASPLKLTLGGYREQSNGTIGLLNSRGHYWASNVTSSTTADALRIDGGVQWTGIRGDGFSVRCIKD